MAAALDDRGSGGRLAPQAKRNQSSGGFDQAGFTLIEALIAMVVTVIALVGLVTTFALAMKTNSMSQNLTAATTMAQDKLEQLETISYQQLSDPSRMLPNPDSQTSNDTLIVGNLSSDSVAADGTYYYDKLILARPGDPEPDGSITVVTPNGLAETRRPDGTVDEGNPYPDARVDYLRRWEIMSSTEPNVADRRLTLGVRVISDSSALGKTPEQVDLYTILTNK